MEKLDLNARRRARKLVLQALYQWQIADTDLLDIEVQFSENDKLNKVDTKYFRELLHKIPKKVDIIDRQISKFLDRPFKDLNPVELAILRIGCYELLYRKEIPYKVAINEALELAKKFGAIEGYKYVNGILDQIAKQTRSKEIQQQKGS